MLKYYSLFGFHCVSDAKFDGKFMSILIFLCQVSACTWCSFIAFISFAEQKHLMEYLDALNCFVYYLIGVLTYWFIIYDSYAHFRIEIEFWQIFQRIDQKYANQSKLSYGNHLSTLTIRTAVNVAIMIFAYNYENITEPQDKIMTFILINFFDHRVLFYFLHMKVVSFQLLKIKEEVERFQKNGINSEWFRLKNDQYKQLRDYYRLVYEMTECMNKAFGWSNVAIILLNLITTVTFLNFIYSQTDDKFENFNGGLALT